MVLINLITCWYSTTLFFHHGPLNVLNMFCTLNKYCPSLAWSIYECALTSSKPTLKNCVRHRFPNWDVNKIYGILHVSTTKLNIILHRSLSYSMKLLIVNVLMSDLLRNWRNLNSLKSSRASNACFNPTLKVI